MLVVLETLPVIAAPAKSADTEHFFPLIADGDGFQSRLFVGGVSDTANRCTLALQGPGLDSRMFQANAAVTPSGASAAIALAGGAGTTLTSSGAQALTFGYAKLDCAEPVVARMLLSLKNGRTLLSLTVLESAGAGRSFQFPALPRLGRLALVISSEANLDADCAVELESETGASIGGANIAVPARSTVLGFLDELIPIPNGFVAGKARVSCNRNVAALGLPLSGAVFTALPAIDPEDEAGESTHVLPLIQDGDGFRSELLVTNLAQAANRCSIDLHGGELDIARFEIPADGTASGNGITLEFAAEGEQASLLSTGERGLAYGHAAIECDGPVAARNLLTVDAEGNLAGMTAVPSVRPAGEAEFPVLPELGQLALAMSNVGASALSCTVEFSRSGHAAAETRQFGIASRSTSVRFLGDLFTVSDDFSRGAVKLDCDGNFSAIALPQNGTVFAAMSSIPASRSEVTAAAAVRIPDPNLHGLLIEILGKESGEPIYDFELEALEYLDASDAGIESLEGLQYATGLKSLYLPENSLTGPIPVELGQLVNLRNLSLWGNRLTGAIPSWFGRFGNLSYLSLSGNQLTGNIPGELGQLSNLEGLDLAGNQLTGPIPAELGQLVKLSDLALGDNRLSGNIPAELGRLENLESLYISNNRLSGPIPKEFGQLPNLRHLSFFNNDAIAGFLPGEMHERFTSGELAIDFDYTQIIGFAAPPKRSRNPSYSEDPQSNGNASHGSIAYYQGPLMMRSDFDGKPVNIQKPIIGRWAMLAVSVLHGVPEPPLVITRVLDPDGLVLDESLAEAASPGTNSTGDGNWLTEYYFDVPGALFQAGNRFVHVIDPENELVETDEEDNVWEPFTVQGQAPPAFRVTFVPIQLATDNEGWHEEYDLDPEALMSTAWANLPIADDFEARTGSVLRSNSARDTFDAIKELELLWNREAGANEFYHGLLSGFTDATGIAQLAGRVAVSVIYPPAIIGHEIGHNLTLKHTPGCGAESSDESYPYPEGKLGPTTTWDVNWRRFETGADDRFGDTMSYCTDSRFGFDSISDYHYRKAADYWLSFRPRTGTSGVSASPVVTAEGELRTSPEGGAGTDSQSAASATEEAGSFALAGRIGAAGGWSMAQAELSRRSPRPPPANGEFTLILFDNAGERVYVEPLAVIERNHSDESLWAARTPLPARAAREILILDAQGNEMLRRLLPELE